METLLRQKVCKSKPFFGITKQFREEKQKKKSKIIDCESGRLFLRAVLAIRCKLLYFVMLSRVEAPPYKYKRISAAPEAKGRTGEAIRARAFVKTESTFHRFRKIPYF
jgi:hypothetical protein